MKSLKHLLLVSSALSTLLVVHIVTAAEGQQQKPDLSPETPKIQLAILLDTSGSMSGLINQARTQLWKIVNELATTRRNEQTPEMSVALYEYGKSSLSKQSGYLRKIVPLTDDLDKISNELFALTTNGGEEYCGKVIDVAINELEWSNSNDDLKLIFIAGNESFTQGDIDYREATANAIAKGITVSTIFCGPKEEGIRTGWEEGAKLADGSFLSIDQNRQVATVTTPYDKKLAELSSAVNSTYLLFGKRSDRRRSAKLQLSADAAASQSAPAAAAERAAFKGSGLYRASGRDLVDALKNGKVKLREIKKEELPEELKRLNAKDQEALIAAKSAERKKIQQQIRDLSSKRHQYITEQANKGTSSKAETLDTAIIKAIRKQAAKKQFSTKQK